MRSSIEHWTKNVWDVQLQKLHDLALGQRNGCVGADDKFSEHFEM
jgi:hypothetical protein